MNAVDIQSNNSPKYKNGIVFLITLWTRSPNSEQEAGWTLYLPGPHWSVFPLIGAGGGGVACRDFSHQPSSFRILVFTRWHYNYTGYITFFPYQKNHLNQWMYDMQ